MNGLMDPLIDRNTTLPTKKSKIFTTAYDYQTAVTIHIVQGERAMVSDCFSLGEFTLVKIPPAPRGVPQIEVTFDIDVNGILNVTAKDIATFKQDTIIIKESRQSPQSLDDATIRRLREEVYQYSEATRNRYEHKVDMQSTIIYLAYDLITAANNTLNYYLKDKLESQQISKINMSVERLKDAIASNDEFNIKIKTQELKRVLDEISAEYYSSKMTHLINPISSKEEDISIVKLTEYYENSLAIIIGVNRYKEEVSLSNAYNDANGINKVVVEQYGFSNLIPPLFNERATKDKLEEIFVDILPDEEKIGKRDRILVYYSGHGKLRTYYGFGGQEIKEGYIVPYDSKLKKYSSNISMETIVKGCQNCPAKHVLLILDCCYSGAAFTRGTNEPPRPKRVNNAYIKDITSRRAIQVLAAGQEDEPVSDSGVRPGYSAFTGALLDTLEPEIDLDNNGILSVSEIGSYLEQQVALQNGRQYQRPAYNRISGSDNGDFIFKIFRI